jgi:hypothetical protein
MRKPDDFHLSPETEKAYGYTQAVRIGDDMPAWPERGQS